MLATYVFGGSHINANKAYMYKACYESAHIYVTQTLYHRQKWLFSTDY